MLATPASDERHVIFEGMGHDLSARRNEIIREALGWLDKYLGAPR
jgi:dipeptidyl aminopeptidase/acylaminoacyl peptidase